MNTTVLRGELVSPDHRYQPNLALEVRAAFLARYTFESTRSTYAIAVDQWYQWCADQGLDPMDAKRGHLELFARALEAHGRKASTVAGKLHILSGLYQFAVADEMIDRNPMTHVRRPTVERGSTSNALTRTELHDVIAAAKAHSHQDHAVIALLA